MNEMIENIVERENHLKLDSRDKAIFVGDTHGDFEVSKKVWKRFGEEVKNETAYLVFLGDYVDRGRDSRKNINYLLAKKKKYSNGIILLLGNHETYPLQRFKPADFWESLSSEEYEYYKKLICLPLIASSNDVVAAHGCFPFTQEIDKLNLRDGNEVGMPIWRSVVWGDLNEKINGVKMTEFTGRAKFSKKLVCDYMKKMGWNVFIRSHQPYMQGWFSDSVLTIFTSKVYIDLGKVNKRTIATVNLNKDVKGKEDVNLISV